VLEGVFGGAVPGSYKYTVDRHAHGHAHLGQQYERYLDDLFSDPKRDWQRVAERLTPRSHLLRNWPLNAANRRPTAFDLTRAAASASDSAFQWQPGSAWLQAIDLLNQAVARDPSFFQAYCELAWAHGSLYYFGVDHTPCAVGVRRSSRSGRISLRPDAVKRTRAGESLH